MNTTTIMPEAVRLSTEEYAGNLASSIESEISEQYSWARRAIKTARDAGLEPEPHQTVFAAKHTVYHLRRVAEMSGLDVRRHADDVLGQLSALYLEVSSEWTGQKL